MSHKKFAISREHAACAVDDIRETARLGDEIAGVSMFSDINAAIEEAIWRRYNGEQQRHFCLVQRGNMIAVVQDRDNKYPNAMWTTRNFLE